MRLKRGLVFPLCLGGMLSAGPCMAQQNGSGCAYNTGPCVNPVFPVDVTNPPFTGSTWVLATTPNNVTYTITSAGGIVSGTATSPNPNSASCPTVAWSVTGSVTPALPQIDGEQGQTSFTWSATNPQPSATCAGWTPIPFTAAGVIQNDGNDLAYNVQWSEQGASGTATLEKQPSDIPASETTTAVGFSSTYVTVGQFRQTLNASCCDPAQDLFKGRQIYEATGFGTNYDNCWFPGSPVAKFDHVDGSVWNVGYYAVNPPFITSENVWADDYIGWTITEVRRYRALLTPSSFPCGAHVPQWMYIETNGDQSQGLDSVNYLQGYVASQIWLDHVSVTRNGVTQTVYQ